MAPLSAHLTSKLQKEFYTFDISLMDIEYLQNTNKVYHYIVLSHIGWRHSDHGFPCKQEWLWLYFGDLFFDIASNKCQCVIECWQTGFINQHCLTSHTSAVVLSIGSKNSTWRIGWF